MTDKQLKTFAETQVVLALVDRLESEIGSKDIVERASVLDAHNDTLREQLSALPNMLELEQRIISYGEAFVDELLKRVEDANNDDN